MGKETLDKLEKFNQKCSENLAGAIDEILKAEKEKKVPAIGFITTDDFYGFYLTWDYDNSNIDEYYDWKQGAYPNFLYQPLVDAVDACKEIDFCNKSEEKWSFARAILTILEESIKQIPDEIFQKNNYRREDILFFATMSDGDYIEEMLDTSVKMFNTLETLEAYGLIQ